MFVTLEGNQTGSCAFVASSSESGRQVESVEGIKKKQRADPFVKILAAATEGVEFGAFPQQ